MRLLGPGEKIDTDEKALAFLVYENEFRQQLAQGLYRCRRGQGDTILEALETALRAALGKHLEDPTP